MFVSSLVVFAPDTEEELGPAQDLVLVFSEFTVEGLNTDSHLWRRNER